MNHIDIKLTQTGDLMTAISIASQIAKCLKLEILYLDLQEGISLPISHESRVVDLYNIAWLEIENKKLKNDNCRNI